MSFGAKQLNAVINYNSQVIAYANDFLFIFFAGLSAFVAIYLMRKPTTQPVRTEIEMEMVE
jgi:hypothetical protein